MINWKTLKDRNPTNAGRRWEGAPETPYIPCLVWACSPPTNGVFEDVRWDTKNGCWLKEDMRSFIFSHPNPYVITHFED